MKTCSACGVEKTLESFYRYHRSKDGHIGTCKRCFCARQARYKAKKLAVSRWHWMSRYQSSLGVGSWGSSPAPRGGKNLAGVPQADKETT